MVNRIQMISDRYHSDDIFPVRYDRRHKYEVGQLVFSVLCRNIESRKIGYALLFCLNADILCS